MIGELIQLSRENERLEVMLRGLLEEHKSLRRIYDTTNEHWRLLAAKVERYEKALEKIVEMTYQENLRVPVCQIAREALSGPDAEKK